MGTRSTTKFIEVLKDEEGNEKEEVMCAIYTQYDGYPDGVGMQIAEFLNGMEIVNGFSDTSKRIANGIGCLAAQYIAHIKDGVGNVYMTHPDDSQQYNYEIIIGYEGEGWDMKPTTPIIRVELYDRNFEGTPQEFIDMVAEGVE